jgi:hypothetical protein
MPEVARNGKKQRLGSKTHEFDFRPTDCRMRKDMILPGFEKSSKSELGLKGFFAVSAFAMGQGKVKRDACSNFAFRPDAAALSSHDAPDAGQTDAGPLEFALAMKPLKHPVKLDAVNLVEASDLAIRAGKASNFDLSLSELRSELERVSNQALNMP